MRQARLISSLYSHGPRHGNGRISDLAVRLNVEAAATATGYNRTPGLVKTYKAARPMTFTIADLVADTEAAAA